MPARMVRRPRMMPSVGETMRSISTPNGSMPSACELAPGRRQALELVEQSHHRFTREVFDLQRKILHGLHVRQDAHRNRDVESILDLQQQIHDLERVQLEIAQQIGVFADLDAPLRQRRQLVAELGQDLRVCEHDVRSRAVR